MPIKQFLIFFLISFYSHSTQNSQNHLNAEQIKQKMTQSIMSKVLNHNEPEQLSFSSGRINQTNQQIKTKNMGTIHKIIQTSEAKPSEQEIRNEMGITTQTENFIFQGVTFTQLNAADCKDVSAIIEFDHSTSLEAQDFQSEVIPLDFRGHYDNYQKFDCDELKGYLAKGIQVSFLGKEFKTGLDKEAPLNDIGSWAYKSRSPVLITASRVQLQGLGHLKGVLKEGSSMGSNSNLKRLCVELSMSNENMVGDQTGRQKFVLI